jgi:hypothetical protein
VQGHEPARGEEAQEQEQDPGVTAAPGGLPGHQGEARGRRSDGEEEDEVQRCIGPVPVPVVDPQQGEQPDQRQAQRDDEGDHREGTELPVADLAALQGSAVLSHVPGHLPAGGLVVRGTAHPGRSDVGPAARRRP